MPVVPTKAMSLLERNLQDDEELVKVCLRPNDVLFRTERAMLYSRLVEGRFPAYRQVLPKKPAVKVPLPVAPFFAAVRQAAIMTDDESKRVTFRFAKDKLTLEAQGATTGRSQGRDAAGRVRRQDDQHRLQPGVSGGDAPVLPPDADLTLDLIDGNSPALFRQGGDYSYLVMPLT